MTDPRARTVCDQMGVFLKERDRILIGEAHRELASFALEAANRLKPSALFDEGAAAAGAIKGEALVSQSG